MIGGVEKKAAKEDKRPDSTSEEGYDDQRYHSVLVRTGVPVRGVFGHGIGVVGDGDDDKERGEQAGDESERNTVSGDFVRMEC